MPDFSYLDSNGIGQIDAPFQTPHTLDISGQQQFAPPPQVGPIPAQGQGNMDFANLWKTGEQPKQNVPLFNDTLDPAQFKGKVVPRSFDADRLVPYKQSDAFKDLGFNPNMPEDKQQAQYDYDQSNWEAAKSSVTDLFHVASQSFGNYFKTYGDTVKSLVNWNQQGVMYNDFIPQQADDQERARQNLRFKGDVPMHWYNYLPLPGLMKGDVAEELLPQLGFTVGTGAAAALENLGVSLLTAGTGEPVEAANTARKLYNLISDFTTVGRGVDLAKNMYQGTVSGLRAGIDMWRLTNATLSETALEGAQGFVQHKQKLIDDFIAKNGHAPGAGTDDMKKIEDSAHSVANDVMWGEFPILFASNFTQYRNLLAPGLAKKLAENEALSAFNIVNKAADGIASDFAVEGEKHGFAHGAIHFLKNATSEGLEESGQNFVQNVASDYEQNKYNKTKNNVFDSVMRAGMPDILSDNGLQQFMGGFVTGSIFHTLGMAGNRLATMNGVFDKDGKVTGKQNILTRLGFGTEEIAKANTRNYMQGLADILNTEDLTKAFKDEGLVNYVKSVQDSQALNAALKENDLFNIGNLKSNALTRFLWTGMETGKLDLRLDQLNAFRGQNQDQINQFFGVDTGVSKDNMDTMIGYINDKAQSVQEIFDGEKERFATKEQDALTQHNRQLGNYRQVQQEMRTKYNIDASEDDVRAGMSASENKGGDFAQDMERMQNATVNANTAYLNYIKVREGRKAAVFAAASMDTDAERSRKLLTDLGNKDMSYMDLRRNMNVKDIDSKLRELYDTSKAVQGIDNHAMLDTDREIKRLEYLRQHVEAFFEDNNPDDWLKGRDTNNALASITAHEIYRYSHPDTEFNPEAIRNRQADEKQLTELLKIERRNQDNLNLYNRLTTSDKDFQDYTQHEVGKTLVTMAKWSQEYMDQLAGQQPVATPGTQQQTDAERHIQEATAQGEEGADSPVEPPTTEDPIDQRHAQIRSKLAAGEALTQNDEQFLSAAGAMNDNVAATAQSYFQAKQQQEEPEAQPEPEPVANVVHSTEDTRHTPGQGEYVPEPNVANKPDEVIEQARVQEHNGQAITNPNRTIVNEVPRSEFGKVTPKLEGGYTAFKQGFFDHISQNDLLDRFTGVLTLDSSDNYPEGSREAEWLKSNKGGLVLKIKDRNGNELFNENYLADRRGQRIVYSLPNSKAKTDLAGAMNVGEEIPVELQNISQGVFDELKDPRATSELVEGISDNDYSFMIAQGPAGEIMYYDNGMALRNGGLYIKTQGSYIKLLPGYVGDIKLQGYAPDITSLIGRAYNNFNEGKTVIDFLQKIFYTNREKGGIVFDLINNGSQYIINASMQQSGRRVDLSAVELAGALKVQRMNIDASSIGTEFTFLHVGPNGEILGTKMLYNDLLKENTLTNKKAYETAEGKKVMRPVNRYATLASTIDGIYAGRTIKPEVKHEESEVEPPSITDQPVKPTRRRFNPGNTNEGFEDIDKLFKAKTGVTELTVPMQAEADWINSTFKNPDLAKLKSIIDANAWGTWSKSGIELLQNAPQGTGYHEAWHHFSQLYLSPEQRISIYNEARQRLDALKGASDFHVEEALAEDFREYVLSNGQKVLGNAPQRNTIFRRILGFLKRIFTGNKGLDRVYRDLYTGNINRYQPSINNAQFGKLNSKITDKNGNELMNNQNSFRFLNHMESIAGQVLAQNNISPTQFMTNDRDITRARRNALAAQMRTALAQQANDLDDQINAFETKNPGASTPLLETWENLSKVLDNFPAVFKQYYLQSAYNTHVLGTTDAEQLDYDVEASELAEANFGGKGWDTSGNEESVLDSASSETKALIRGLSKVDVDKEGNPIKVGGKVQLSKNEQGLYEPVNFVRTINNIANLLEGSFSYEEMIGKIRDTNNQKRFPELALLAERLPDHTQPLKYPEIKQLSSFLKNFSKTYVPIYSLVKLNSGDFLFREETRKSQDLIERTWGNNFTTMPADSPYRQGGENAVVLEDEATGRLYINPATDLNLDLQKPEVRREFLNFLGIQITQRAEGSKQYEANVTATKLGYILNSLRNRLKAGQKIFNPVADLKKPFYVAGGKQILSEKSTINALTNLEAKFTDTNPSMAFRNVEGNMNHGLSENNWVTNNNYYLSRTEHYSQITGNPNTQHLNIGNNPYILHSLFLNKLFNLDPNSTSYGARRRVNGEPVTLTFANYNGYEQEQEEGNNKGALTTKLSPRDKLIMDINSLLMAGAVEIMRTESSGSAFFVKLSDYASQDGKVQDLPFLPEELGANPDNPKVLEYFNGAVQDEMSTIVNKFNSELPSYNRNIGRFTMFDGILSEDTKDKIMKSLKEARDSTKMSPSEKQAIVDQTFSKYRDVIERDVAKFMQDEVRDFYKLLKERDINMNDISNTITKGVGGTRGLSLPEIATAFVVNDFVLNSEFAKLFDGNVGFFKAYHKRAKGNTSTGTRAFSDDFLKAYLNSTKGSTLAGVLGDRSDVNLNTTKTVTFKDDQRRSVYTADRNALYIKAFKALNGGVDNESELKMLESKYNSMNVADGQGHGTLDFYRELRMRVANWSFADEVQYRKEVIGYKERKGLYTDEADRQRDQKFLEDYKDASSTFPPMKMQYNGALDMKGAFAPVLDKFSVAPLIPSVIAGTVWDTHNDKLLKEGIGYTKFESGTKKYKFTPQEFYAATDGFTSSLGSTADPYDAATHFAEGLKEQLRTSSDPKDEATWGTQMRKLFLANLFSSGMAPEKFRNILNNYVDLLNRVEDQQRKQLYKEFGITEDGDQIQIKDLKNFVRTLQNQVDARSLNDNIKNFLQYDEATKSFGAPLEVSLNKAQVQDLISGMIFNRLTRLKVNGDMLIQVASSGFESPDFKYTNATTEDNIKYGSNGLPFYEPIFNDKGEVTGTKAMRVKVALIKEWTKLLSAKHMDGKKIGTLERLNEALRDDKWREDNRRKITMIGYRIPTQGANSMEFMEVHEFLPSVAGSIVILPAEIVAKAGSDYDIDKMPIIRPSLTDEGEMADEAPEIYEKKMEKIRKKLEGLFKQEKEINSTRTGHDYSDADRFMDKVLYGYDAEDLESEIDGLIIDNDHIQELLQQYMRVASNRRGSLTNQVIDQYKAVLSSPEMFKQLILPNNVDLMKPIAQSIAKMIGMAGFDEHGGTKEFTNTDVLKYRSNLVKFEQLLSGKRDVGIFAKANTMSQLLQQGGMNVAPVYVIHETLKGILTPFRRSYNLNMFTPEEKQALQTTKVAADGKTHTVIDYSSNVDANGVYKQDYFSQLINATVDVAGDPWYMGLRLNDKVKGILVHMLNQGVPAQRAIYFLNHPVIQNYTKQLIASEPQQKWNIVAQYLTGKPTGRKVDMLNLIEGIDSGTAGTKNGNFYFDEKTLASHIKDPGKSDAWYNRAVLAHFLKLEEQSNALRDLSTTTSFDTAKYLTPISAQNNLDLRSKVKATRLFDPEAINKIMSHSMISPFNNIDKTIKIFAKLMPIGMSSKIVEASASLMREFIGDKGQRIRLERTLNNDWIEFLIKNYGRVNGMNFEDYAKDLIIYNGGNIVLSQELSQLKNTMPGLNYFDAFKKLYNAASERSEGWRNIAMDRGLDNSSDYQNVLIEELTQLTNFQGNEVPGHTFTPSQIMQVRDFFTKLGYLAFQQSGFNKSRLYFTDIIPSDNLVPIFKQALSRYQEAIGVSPEHEDEIINAFLSEFREQNANFGLGQSESKTQAWRGKLYKVVDDQGRDELPNANPPDYMPSDSTFKLPGNVSDYKIPYRVSLQAWNYGDLIGRRDTPGNRAIINDHVLNLPDQPLFGGESFNQARNRAIGEFRSLLQDTPDGTLLITHSSVLKMFDLWNKAQRPADNSFDYKAYTDTTTTPGEVVAFKSAHGTIYVARHGQSLDNALGILRTNGTELSKAGVEQANRIADYFKDKVPPVLLSSPLTRAMQTAKIISDALGMNIISDKDIDDGLNNCNI